MPNKKMNAEHLHPIEVKSPQPDAGGRGLATESGAKAEYGLNAGVRIKKIQVSGQPA
jgi:hypothetical protein